MWCGVPLGLRAQHPMLRSCCCCYCYCWCRTSVSYSPPNPSCPLPRGSSPCLLRRSTTSDGACCDYHRAIVMLLSILLFTMYVMKVSSRPSTPSSVTQSTSCCLLCTHPTIYYWVRCVISLAGGRSPPVARCGRWKPAADSYIEIKQQSHKG